MKRTFLTAASAAALLCSGVAFADNHEEGMQFVPVEGYACNYREGKGRADLDAAVDAFNEWSDEAGIDDYFATILTPNYMGERTADFFWLGAWKDGNAMGARTDQWLAASDEVGEAMFGAIDCVSHTNFASTQIKPGPDGDDDDSDTTWVLAFANCNVGDGKTFDDVMAGMSAWAEHQGANGFQNSTYMMFPIWGESDDSYDFKVVTGYDDHSAMGADYELMGNGGHWVTEMELLGGLVNCDSPRVYDASFVRDWEDD